MTPIRRGSIRLPVLTLAVGLTALTLMALACAPAAPAGQGAPTPGATPAPEPTPTILWLSGTPPSESELATWAARPTRTPYPPGYVKPTDPPYAPPLSITEISATLAASIATEEAQLPPESAPAQGVSTTLPPPLTEQVAQFARDMRGRYDVVAHVRAGASRDVKVPADVEWPHNQGTFPALTRTLITPVTIYSGTLPAKYELVIPQWATWAILDEGQEYILFIIKAYASQSKCSEGRSPGQRCLNSTQLNAVGGPGGLYMGSQAWIVDGDQAWRIPDDKELPLSDDFDSTAEARTSGEGLSLRELETAIRAGRPE